MGNVLRVSNVHAVLLHVSPGAVLVSIACRSTVGFSGRTHAHDYRVAELSRGHSIQMRSPASDSGESVYRYYSQGKGKMSLASLANTGMHASDGAITCRSMTGRSPMASRAAQTESTQSQGERVGSVGSGARRVLHVALKLSRSELLGCAVDSRPEGPAVKSHLALAEA